MQTQIDHVDASKSIIKDKIREMIKRGDLDQAKEALMIYEQKIQHDPDITLLIADILEREGNHATLAEVLHEGLLKYPGNFKLLYRLGKIFENQKEYYSAWDTYLEAMPKVSGSQQRKMLRQALGRCRANLKSGQNMFSNGFSIVLKGDRDPVVLNYRLDKLKKRRALLQAILEQTDSNCCSALELECAAGMVSRILGYCGLKTLGLTENPHDLYKARSIEFPKQARQGELVEWQVFEKFILNKQSAQNLNGYDLVLLLPEFFSWYKERGLEEVRAIVKILAEKANRQFFIYLPFPDDEDSNDDDERLRAVMKDELVSLFNEMQGRLTEKNLEQAGTLLEIAKAGLEEVTRGALIPGSKTVLKGKSKIVKMNIEDLIGISAFTYGKDGWHYYSAVIRELEENPNLLYEESSLKRFYDRFQPKNRLEQWLDDCGEELYPLSRGWPNLPWYDMDKQQRLIPKTYSNPRRKERGGNQHWGPNSDRFGREELARIKAAYEMMKTGYLPKVYPDGFIKGYLLKRGEKVRLLVTEGQHRIAALDCLGYREINCLLDPNAQTATAIVDISEVSSWPLVKSGLYSREVAEKVFNAYMDADGNNKAKRLGLI